MKKSNLQSIAIGILFFSTIAQASPVVVNSKTCNKVQGMSAPFILAVNSGESLIDAILKCANAAQLSGAAITGVGTVKNPRLHYYDNKTKQNIYRSFDGSYELVSLIGNLAIQDGKRVVHLHAGLGDKNYQMIGGHLESAQVTALAEITFIPLAGPVLKMEEPETGFEVLSTASHS